MTDAPPLILLVEDDAAIRESLAECLELEGCRVAAFADGAAALAWLAEGGRPRVAVFDLVMPRVTGEEFLRALRADPAHRELPAILMTAASPRGSLPAADALLVKPFELNDFLDLVKRHLR